MNRITNFQFENEPKVNRITVSSIYDESQKSICFKIIQMYYKLLHILACMDFGFLKYKSNKQKKYCNLISLFQVILYCVVFWLHILELYRNRTYALISCIVLFLYYIANVMILSQINIFNTFYSMLEDLKIIDMNMRADLSNKSNAILIIFNGLHAIFRAALLKAHCVVFSTCDVAVFVFFLMIFLQHTVLVSYSTIFYLISCRLKKLVSITERDSNYSALHGIYKAIVDLAEAQKAAFDPMFILALLYNTPQVMASMYFVVFYENNAPLANQLLNYTALTESLILTLMPAVCAGMITSQASRLQNILHDKLLVTKDESKVKKILLLIQYVQERDCRFRVYQLIPLDASLIGMVLNFCVTYLIVIIQFSK